MIEADVEKYLIERVSKLGGEALKLKWAAGVGFPDRTIILPRGRVAFLELKRPRGGRKGPMQPWWINRLLKMGFHCGFAKTTAEVDEFLSLL